MVDGHCNLPDSGHQAGTAAVTDGERAAGATSFGSAPIADFVIRAGDGVPCGRAAQNDWIWTPRSAPLDGLDSAPRERGGLLADGTARSAVDAVHRLKDALLHQARPAAVSWLAGLIGAERITAQPPKRLDDDRAAGCAV